MAEIIREIKIIVQVDTNKATYEKEFDNLEDASEWLDDLLNDN